MTFGAIETRHRGYRFRSRLEARWAVFFDACKQRYLYEHEGYRLPSGSYLPDFFFPQWHAFLEVKPNSALPRSHFEFQCDDSFPIRDDDFPREIVLALDLVYLGLPNITCCVIVYGDPLDVFDYYNGEGGAVSIDKKRGIQASEGFLKFFSPVIDAAFTAREARFEHGAG